MTHLRARWASITAKVSKAVRWIMVHFVAFWGIVYHANAEVILVNKKNYEFLIKEYHVTDAGLEFRAVLKNNSAHDLCIAVGEQDYTFAQLIDAKTGYFIETGENYDVFFPEPDTRPVWCP